MTPEHIHLTIDRLVLDAPDLAPADVPRLVAALERELARLLAEPRAFDPAARDRVDLSPGTVSKDLSPGTASPDLSHETASASTRDPAALGRDLARSLSRALGGAP